MALFRPEVLAAKRSVWLGRISVAQPIGAWMVSCIASIFAIGVLLFIAVGSYTQRSRVSGRLVPAEGLVTVATPVRGVVAKLYVKEGEVVQRGDPLAVIASPRSTASGVMVATEIENGMTERRSSLMQQEESQLARLNIQRNGYSRQLNAALDELRMVNDATEIRRKQVRIAQSAVERMRLLSRDGLVSQLQVEQEELRALDLLSQQRVLELQAVQLDRSIELLKQSLQEIEPQKGIARSSVEGELAELEQQRIERQVAEELLVRATVGGLVTHRPISPGDSVEVGVPLFTVLPQDSRLRAQLLVPSRSIGFINIGDRVLLRYQAFPFQKFGQHLGKVAQISRSAMRYNGATEELGAVSEVYYRIFVDLENQHVLVYGQPEPLLPDMVVEADIMGDTRRIYQWMFEPLFSVSGRLL